MSKKNKVICLFLILSTVSVFCHRYAQAQNNQNECPAPANTSFVLTPRDTVITNYSAASHSVQFTSSAESADRLEWDFGDGQNKVQNKCEADFGKPSHSYSYAGTYMVTLTAVKICADKSEKKGEPFKQDINIFDADLLKCGQHKKLSEIGLKVYKIDALIIWIKSLREDITKKKEMMASWEDTCGALKKIKKWKPSAIKISELKRIIKSLGEPESKPTGTIQPENRVKILTQESEKLTDSTVDKFIADMEEIRALELAEGRELLNSCNESLAVLEYVIRKRGDYFLDRIHTENDLKQTQGISEDEVKKHDDEIKKLKERVKKIKPITPLAGDDLFQSFSDYEQYFFKFSAGYEFTTVNKLFQKGNFLIGFTVYRRMNEDILPDSQYEWAWPIWGGYGWQSKLSVLVSGSGEQETVSLPTSTTSTALKNPGTDQAMGFDEELFAPIYRTASFNDGKLHEYFGPVVLVGARIVDVKNGETVSSDITSRLYAGVKFAINPELYTDILYGKTQKLQSKRLELRAQMPIYRVGNGSRFFLGAVANMGVKDKTPEEADNFRVYITWNINFDNVYSYFSGKKLDQSSENK